MDNDFMKFDHYNSRFSYMKLIMDTLDRYEIEKIIVGEVFNVFSSRLDSNEIKEIVIYSSLFESKINKLNDVDKKALLNDLYEKYVKNIILNFSNGDIDAVIMFFNELEDKIKVISGYYGIYGEEGYFNNVNERLILKH